MMPSEIKNIDLDNAEFQNAWKLIRFTRQSIFLTGKAGTGKSTFLRYVCENTAKKFVVLAPTGIAAVNVGGQTLHSFFRIPFKPLLPDDPEFDVKRFKSRMKYPKPLQKLIQELDLIIIDEISMVRADIIDFIDKALRIYSGNMREPFGGKQLLLVGDIFQLEPVVTGDMRDILSHTYPQQFFFCAKAFSQLSIVPIELTKVYRQTDSCFIDMLDRIRIGRPLPSDISMLNDRIVPSGEAFADGGAMVMTLATKRDMVDAINDSHLAELASPEVCIEGTISGDFPENSLPNPLELVLKVGAQVVFVKNDPDRRWVNGTLGRVYMVNEDSVMVETEDGEKHQVEPAVWSNVRYTYNEAEKKVEEEVLGTFTQIPLKLAWALTIHKSQGLTFKDVVIDLGRGTFSGGQAYVALSRCRSLAGLRLVSTINERDIFVNPAVVRFSRMFNDDSVINDALERAKADDAYSEALDAVKRSDLLTAFDRFTEALRLRNELDNQLLMRFARRKLASLSSFKRKADELQSELDASTEKLHRLALEYVAMGDECRREGMDPTPILANYDKALDLWPENVKAWMGKGLTYSGISDDDLACACFRKVQELDPKNFLAPFMLGNVAFTSGEYAEALNQYLIALSIDDTQPHLHDRLAELYDKVDDISSADEHRVKAKALRKKRRK
ncbi:MAG: AAA family ATPase [Muribaculum sp.]|nr:AAA family ATPase [Muribaculum sp.]